MKPSNPTWISRLAGYTIIGASLVGLVLCAWGLFTILRFRGPFLERAGADLTLLAGTLTATQDGLATAGETLATTQESVDTLVSTLEAVAKSIQDTTPVIETLSQLIDADLPATILSTRRSIVSAQTSARLIDDILGSLTSIPLFNLDRYAPQVPLNVALGQVAESLAELPASLYEMEAGMEATRRNVSLTEIQVRDIAYQVNLLNGSLEEATTVITSYEILLDELVNRTDYIQTHLERWVNNTVIILTIILAWLAITQIGLFAQGMDLLRSQPAGAGEIAAENTPTAEEK